MMDLNPGTRNSHLALDRLTTGELGADEAAAVRARMTEADRAHVSAAEAARGAMPRFDPAAIRARAASLVDVVAPAPAAPKPANSSRWALLGSVVAVAAALLLAVRLAVPTPTPDDPGGVRFKGGDALEVVQLVGREPRDYVAGTAVGEGAVLGFRVQATGHETVVVLSVDGRGEATVFWPTEGEAEALQGDGLVALEGSVVLDDAPGPEVFVAVYDRPVADAVELVKAAWGRGGSAGVSSMADAEPGVYAVEVTRR